MKKKTALDQRLSKLEKELAHIDSDMRALSRRKLRPGESLAQESKGPEESKAGKPAGGIGVRPEKADSRYGGGKLRSAGDQRFIDFMATNLKPARSLRHERRVQRNKAIVAVVFVLLVMVWFLYRFVL